MADGETTNSGDWKAAVLEGGLPQLLAGPAGKAISRLVGTAADIPAAYIESIAQGIRDKSSARSAVTAAIAERAAELAIADPEIMSRAMDSFLARSYRVQTNKEAVAHVALEELQKAPASAEGEGPSEDWMNKFERYAEDASSDDLRLMFGNLLAGEIRKPGDISPVTLHFVSMLDTETAQLIERVLPVCSADGGALTQLLEPALSVHEAAFIEQCGFWTPGKSLTIKLGKDGLHIQQLGYDGSGIAIKGKPNDQFTLKAAILSRAGVNLASTVSRDFDYASFARAIHEQLPASKVFVGSFSDVEGLLSLEAAVEIDREGNRVG